MPALSVAVRALVVALCIAGAVGSFIGYRSQSETAAVLSEMIAGRADESMLRRLDDADTFLYPDTLRDSTRAITLTRLGRAEEAERVLLRAVEREPENQTLWVTLARVQATLGKPEAARASAARSSALNSQTPLFEPAPIESTRG